MAASSSAQPITVALVGNPNTGKSTLFSALAGVRQRIGNYPGVTVEKKTGQFEHEGRRFEVVDLPGTYSLAPRSPDEMVAVDVLLARRADVPPVDAVLSIVDASNLERNLYLVSQVLELGLPTVIVLNMTDVARSRGLAIDVARLGRQLGVPVVECQANRRLGLAEIKRELAAALDAAPACRPVRCLPSSRPKSSGWRRHCRPTVRSKCRATWSSGCCSTRPAIWKGRSWISSLAKRRRPGCGPSWPRPGRVWPPPARRFRRWRPCRAMAGPARCWRAWSSGPSSAWSPAATGSTAS